MNRPGTGPRPASSSAWVTPVILFAVWSARLHYGHIDCSGALPILVPIVAVGSAFITISNELWRRRALRYPGRLWVSRLAYFLGPGESDGGITGAKDFTRRHRTRGGRHQFGSS